MRRFFLSALTLCVFSSIFAQNDTTSTVKHPIVPSSKDHFMIQIGGLSWTGKPDSIHTGGLSRTINIYVMLAFPFKTDPHWSVAIGPGISTDNMMLDKTNVGIKENTTFIHFTNVSDTNNYKRTKLTTAYAEAPIELRYAFSPQDDAKSVKLALGVKIGTMLSATVKNVSLQNKSGTLINDYTVKEKSKQFFNTTRLSLMGRVGYGHFSLFASYQLTQLFKEGLGPKVQPLSIGLTLSGL